MADLTTAVEVAAKGYFDAQSKPEDGEWETAHPLVKFQVKEQFQPAIAALHEAGFLKGHK